MPRAPVVFLLLSASALSSAAPAAARRVNWYLSSSETVNNAALIAKHGDAITGAYLCCGFGGIAANGSWSSQPTARALSEMAPITAGAREVWEVAGVAEAAVHSGAWARGLDAAAAALAPLAAAGLRGLIIDYEPAANYTAAHAAAYGAFLGALAARLQPLNLAVGMDIAGWGVLQAQFWPQYSARGLATFTSMTPTYNAVNVSADRAFVQQALAGLPAGAFEAGLGTVLAGGAACPMVYGWTNDSFPPFVRWMGMQGVPALAVWRCDIDRQYPDPDPTAPWFFDALAEFLRGGRAPGAAAAPPSASLTGAPATVYDFYAQHCPPLPQPGCALSIDVGCDCDIADAPLRFWRAADGGLRALASVDLGSRGFAAPGPAGSVAALAHTCAVYANSTRDGDFAHYANHEWLHSTWRDEQDASRLVALTHMEYHCDEPSCPYYGNASARDGFSWFTAVTLMASSDGGASWRPAAPPPAHIVAVPPYRWNESLGAARRTFGFRSPSNILRARDGFFYATVTAGWGASLLGQRAGACMMRTRDVTDPAGWRAWGGAAYNVSLAASPYAQPGLDPAAHICAPFTNATYITLAWSTLYRAYLLFGTTGGDDGGGWSFALSDDLVSWRDWTAVEPRGWIAPAGDGRLVPSGAPFSGRFVMPEGGGAQVWWEDAAHTVKRPVGSCTPCPGIDACGSVTRIPAAEWAALRNGSQYGCAWQYNASGTAAYYYPTLIDDAQQGAPNFDVVGATATLTLVANMCAAAQGEPGGGGVRCSPFDDDGLLVRNIVRVPLAFS